MTCSRNWHSGGSVIVRGFGLCVVTLCVGLPGAWAQQTMDLDASGRLNLPSSKQLGAAPGEPQRLNSLPMSMAVSPDGRYVVTVNAGYGTFESQYEQSLAVMDTQTGKVVDFPDERTTTRAGRHCIRGWCSAGMGSICTRAWLR